MWSSAVGCIVALTLSPLVAPCAAGHRPPDRHPGDQSTEVSLTPSTVGAAETTCVQS